MLPKEITDLLHKREFISVATSTLAGKPNAAPKFLLKIEEDTIYLVDYIIGKTCQNIKANPFISLSFIDQHSLKGYQLNGSARVIEKGPHFKKLYNEMMQKEIKLTAQRIIEDVRGEKAHESFEVLITEKFVVLEIRVEEIVEIRPGGEIRRDHPGAGSDPAKS